LTASGVKQHILSSQPLPSLWILIRNVLGFISVQAIRLKKYGEAKEAKGERL
jgi:hypothetical protein